MVQLMGYQTSNNGCSNNANQHHIENKVIEVSLSEPVIGYVRSRIPLIGLSTEINTELNCEIMNRNVNMMNMEDGHSSLPIPLHGRRGASVNNSRNRSKFLKSMLLDKMGIDSEQIDDGCIFKQLLDAQPEELNDHHVSLPDLIKQHGYKQQFPECSVHTDCSFLELLRTGPETLKNLSPSLLGNLRGYQSFDDLARGKNHGGCVFRELLSVRPASSEGVPGRILMSLSHRNKQEPSRYTSRSKKFQDRGGYYNEMETVHDNRKQVKSMSLNNRKHTTNNKSRRYKLNEPYKNRDFYERLDEIFVEGTDSDSGSNSGSHKECVFRDLVKIRPDNSRHKPQSLYPDGEGFSISDKTNTWPMNRGNTEASTPRQQYKRNLAYDEGKSKQWKRTWPMEGASPRWEEVPFVSKKIASIRYKPKAQPILKDSSSNGDKQATKEQKSVKWMDESEIANYPRWMKVTIEKDNEEEINTDTQMENKEVENIKDTSDDSIELSDKIITKEDPINRALFHSEKKSIVRGPLPLMEVDNNGAWISHKKKRKKYASIIENKENNGTLVAKKKEHKFYASIIDDDIKKNEFPVKRRKGRRAKVEDLIDLFGGTGKIANIAKLIDLFEEKREAVAINWQFEKKRRVYEHGVGCIHRHVPNALPWFMDAEDTIPGPVKFGVLPGLYVGNFRDSKDSGQLRQHNITHILSIHDNPRRLPCNSDKEYLCIMASDSPGQNLTQFFPTCNDFIHNARLKNGNVLIHCLAGMSRSVTVAVVYVMCVTSMNWRDALKAVRGARNVANPNVGFLRQLQDFDSERLTEERRRLSEKYPSKCLHEDDEAMAKSLLGSYEHSMRLGEMCDGNCPTGVTCPRGLCHPARSGLFRRSTPPKKTGTTLRKK